MSSALTELSFQSGLRDATRANRRMVIAMESAIPVAVLQIPWASSESAGRIAPLEICTSPSWSAKTQAIEHRANANLQIVVGWPRHLQLADLGRHSLYRCFMDFSAYGSQDQSRLGRANVSSPIGRDTLPKPAPQALLDAILQDDMDAFLDLLSDSRVDFSARTSGGLTVLHVAAKRDNHLAVNALLSVRQDAETINARDRDGRTALAIAATSGADEVVKLLLELRTAGVPIDVDAADDTGITPFMAAAETGHSGSVRLLAECGCDFEARDEGGRTALLLAAEAGQHEVVVELLRHSVDVDAQDDWGRTAIMHAGILGNTATILQLREAGANLEIPDDTGATIFMQVVQGAQTEVLNAFLQPIPGVAGPNIHTTDGHGRNALMLAASEGMWRAVNLLVQHGAQCDAVDVDGETALMAAARRGYISIIEILLAAKANPHLKNHESRTALDLARNCNWTGAVNLLVFATRGARSEPSSLPSQAS